MKWFFLVLALAAATFQASEVSAHFVHRAPRQEIRVERVFFRPQTVFIPTQTIYVPPPVSLAPSASYSYSYESSGLQPALAPEALLYQQYESACRNEGVVALPFEVFSVRSRDFRGRARDFNLRVGPRGRVRIN